MPHSPFSGSIWNALWILLPIAVVTFVSLFCTLGGDWYFFDPKHNIDPKLKDAGDFEPHSKRYQDLSKFAITLSGAAMAFLLSIIASDKPVQARSRRKCAMSRLLRLVFSVAALPFSCSLWCSRRSGTKSIATLRTITPTSAGNTP
jgi:hypothetical protein